MNLQLIKNEIDSGGVFIGEYEDILKLLKYINNEMIISISLIHHKAIEIKKVNNNYIVNPCL